MATTAARRSESLRFKSGGRIAIGFVAKGLFLGSVDRPSDSGQGRGMAGPRECGELRLRRIPNLFAPSVMDVGKTFADQTSQNGTSRTALWGEIQAPQLLREEGSFGRQQPKKLKDPSPTPPLVGRLGAG